MRRSVLAIVMLAATVAAGCASVQHTSTASPSSTWPPGFTSGPSTSPPTDTHNPCGPNTTCCPPTYSFVAMPPQEESAGAELNWSEVPASADRDELDSWVRAGADHYVSVGVSEARMQALTQFLENQWRAQGSAGQQDHYQFLISVASGQTAAGFMTRIC